MTDITVMYNTCNSSLRASALGLAEIDAPDSRYAPRARSVQDTRYGSVSRGNDR